jgi:multimeric flavodoxin WrbA
MRILGISGSPHAEGNTAFALKHALGAARARGAEAEYLSLAGIDIGPCRGCFACSEKGLCPQKDGMDGVIEKMLGADGIILASPVYFGLVSGQLKTMMDRTVRLRARYGGELPLAGKLGGAIACANSRNGGQETALQNMITYLMQMNMKAVSDGPGFCHSGGTVCGNAREDDWGLLTAANLAENMCAMLASGGVA